MSSLIVAGATGAIGREVVCQAVATAGIKRVVALTRKAIQPTEWKTVFGANLDEAAAAAKLSIQAVDWDKLLADPFAPYDAAVTAAFQGHDFAAMCMATTKKDAGSAENFRKCDLLYVEAFGKCLALQSKSTLKHFVQISSSGASSSSWFLYLQTKGEADESIAKLGFPRLTILRPGLLDRGDKARFVEKVGLCVIGGLPVACAGIAIVRSMVDAVAQEKAIAAAAKEMPSGTFFLYDSQILAIAPRPTKS
jgi:oxidoreductase